MAALQSAREALGTAYDEASRELLEGHPVAERLAQAREAYVTALAEQPGSPIARLRDRLHTGLRHLVRLVGSHAPAPPAADGDASAARRRVAEWLAKYEAAAHELTTADQSRRALIDSYVATPEEAVEHLMAVARTFGRVPVHPLLTRGDLPLAERLWTSLAEHPERLERLRLLPSETAPSPARETEHEKLAEALYREVLAPPPASPPGLPPLPLSPEQRDFARQLSSRLLAARPQVVATVDHARREIVGARTVAERAAARDVGAQILYTEAVGKRDLLEAQKIVSGTSRLAAVGWERPGRLASRYLVDGLGDMTRVEPARTAGAEDVTRWNKTLAGAKARIAEARVGLAKLEHATPVQALELDRDALARRVVRLADDAAAGRVAATPEVRERLRELRDLPELRASAVRLDAFARENPPERGAAAAPVSREAREAVERLAPIVRDKERAAATLILGEPELARELRAWRAADVRYAGERIRLAEDAPARARELQLRDDRRPELVRGLQALALKTLPEPQDVSADRSPRIVDTRVGPAPAPAAAPPAPRKPDAPTGQTAPPTRPAPGPAAPRASWEQVAQYVHQEEEAFRKRQGQYAPAGGEAYNRRVAEEKVFQEELRQRVARMVGGDPSWQEIRRNTAGKVNYGGSAYGAVYSRDQLNDPAFLQQMYGARMGGWGTVHTFKDADDYKAFLQSRLGGYGIVHKRSDLQDPKYVEQLYRQRFNGWGWVHTFKNEDDYRKFIQSRLGGLGRAYNCRDLQNLGWRPDQIEKIFEAAQKYAKKPFESDRDYQARMLEEHPGEFTTDENGRFRRKTQAEKDADLRKERLASGKWIEDPMTGRLHQKGSKAGQQLVEAERRRTTTTVEIPLGDGRTLRVEVTGTQSLYDALGDRLRAQGLSRNLNGDWVDAHGRVALRGDKYMEYDQRYTDHKKKTDPDFTAAYRDPPGRIPAPPPTPTQQLASLQQDLKASLGYTARNIDVGGRSMDIEVRPGEAFGDALVKRLTEAGRPARVDDHGNIVDARSGRVLVSRERVQGLDRDFDRKLTESIFGPGRSGFSRETLWLAEHGTPEQRARAQAIIQQTAEQVAALREVTKTQQDLQTRLEALGDRSTLRAADRATYDQLARELAAVGGRRQELERGVLDQTRAANTSAGRVVQGSLSYREREALAANQRAAAAAARVEEIDRELATGMPGPTEAANLRRRRAQAVEELLRAQRQETEHRSELQREQETAARRAGQGRTAVGDELRGTSRIDGLAQVVDPARLGVPPTTVLSQAEAVASARKVVTIGGVSYAADARGDLLVDPRGQPVRLSPGERSTVDQRLRAEAAAAEKERKLEENRRIAALLAQEGLATAARKRFMEQQGSIDRYNATLAGIPDTPQNRERRRFLEQQRDRLLAQQQTNREIVESFQAGYAALGPDGQSGYAGRRQAIEDERAAREKAWLERGEAAVTYVDETGVRRELFTKRQQEYAELKRQEAERLRREAEAVARRARDEQERARSARETEERARAEAQARSRGEAARREVDARRAEESVLLGRAADAQGRRVAAERRQAEAEAAARANPTAANQAALAQARTELGQARQAELDARVAAMSQPSDSRFAETLRAQQEAIARGAQALDQIETTRAAAEQAYRAAVARGAPQGEVAMLRAAWEAVTVESARAHARLRDQQVTLASLLDSGQYALATPEANRTRLAEFERRERENRAAGRSAYHGFSDAEHAEYSRRLNHEWYHRRVGEATARAERIADLSARRERGETLSAVEQAELDRGLSTAELAALRGEAERREILSRASAETDPAAKAQRLQAVEQWMRSGDGGLGGRQLTDAEREAERRRGLFSSGLVLVPRTPSEWYAEQLARQGQEGARREGDTARGSDGTQRAIERNRDIDRQIAEIHRETAAGQQQLRQNYDTARAEADGAARRLDELRRQGASSREIAEAERKVQEANRVVRREMTRGYNLDQYRREEATLTSTISSLDQQLAGLRRNRTMDASEREAAIKNIEEARGRASDRLQELRATPNLAFQARERVAGLEAQRPQAWSYDPAAREREEFVRHQAMLQASHERARREELATAAVREADSRVQAAQREVEQLERDILSRGYRPDATVPGFGRPPAEDVTRLAAARQRLHDAEAGRIDATASRHRQLTEAEREERQLLDQNRRDGVGPTDTYDSRRWAETRGLNYDLLMRADPEEVRRAQALAGRLVGYAQRDQIAAEGPSLLTATLSEVQWSNLADPIWMARAAANAELGAAKALGTMVTDLAHLGYGAVRHGGEFLLSEEARVHAFEQGLGAVDALRRAGVSGVTRGLTQALTEAGRQTMAGLVDRHGNPDEAKIAQLGGNVAFQIFSNFVAPGGAAGTGARVLAQAERAQDAAEAVGLLQRVRAAAGGLTHLERSQTLAALERTMVGVGRAADAAQDVLMNPGAALRAAGHASRDVLSAVPGAAADLLKRDALATLARARAGYGSIDDPQAMAQALQRTRTAAAAMTPEIPGPRPSPIARGPEMSRPRPPADFDAPLPGREPVPGAPAPPAARVPGPADARVPTPRAPGPHVAARPAEPAVPRGPPAGAPGSSVRPLTGVEIEARAGSLDGQIVRLPRPMEGADPGPLTIGKRIGGGEFGHLYQMDGRPGLLKVPTNNAGAAEAMARQAQGFDLIRNAPEIPAPKILARGPGHPGESPYLVVENLLEGDWAKKGAYLKKSGDALSADEVRAARELYDNLARRDLVWLDGHKGNVFFFREGGRVRAGVLDHDMIMQAGDVAKIGRREIPTAEFLEEKLFQDLIGHPAMRTAADGVSGKPFDHRGWMEGRFQRWFGDVPAEKPAPSAVRGRTPDVATAPPPPATGSAPLGGSALQREAKNLQGREVRLPPTQDGVDQGPMRLGQRLGAEGAFGVVYRVEGQPERVVKMIHNLGEGPESVARQVAGFDLIKDAPDIPAPRILGHRSDPNGPSYLILENLNEGRWKDKNVRFRRPGTLTPEEHDAARALHDSLGRRGLVWPDGHLNNVFFFDEGGKVRAGVVDHDMIFPGRAFLDQPDWVQDRVAGAVFGGPGVRTLADAVDGQELDAAKYMEHAFAKRYGERPSARAASAPAVGLPRTALEPPPGSRTAPWAPGDPAPASPVVAAAGPRGPPARPESEEQVREILDRLVSAAAATRERGAPAERVGAARRAVADNAGALEGVRLVRPRGTSGGVDDVVLGRRLGGGTYGQVFEAQDRPDKVVKLFANPAIPESRVREAIEGQRAGMKLLAAPPPGQARIATKAIVGGHPDPEARVPYLVMDKLKGDEAAREAFGAGQRALGDLPREAVEYQVDLAARRAANAPALHPDEQRALVELYRRLADQNLIWQDGHLGNIYFFRNQSGAIEAGILDTDRIVRPRSQHGVVAELRDAMTQFPEKARIPSLRHAGDLAAREDLMRDPHVFMQKMLEYHGFVEYDTKAAAFRARSIDPKLVGDLFDGLVEGRVATQILSENELPRAATVLLSESEILGRPATVRLGEADILPRVARQRLDESSLPKRPDVSVAPRAPAAPSPVPAAPVVRPPAPPAPAAVAIAPSPARGPPRPLGELKDELAELRDQFRRGQHVVQTAERELTHAQAEVTNAQRTLEQVARTGNQPSIRFAQQRLAAARTRLTERESVLDQVREGFRQRVDDRITGLAIALPPTASLPSVTIKTPYGAGRYGWVSQIEEDPTKVIKLGVNHGLVPEWERQILAEVARGERLPTSPSRIREEAVQLAAAEMRQAFRGQVRGARHLESPPQPLPGGERIPYKPVRAGDVSGDPPFLIMDRLQTEPVRRPDGSQYREYTLEGRALNEAEQDAILNVHRSLARQRLGWADGHTGNLYGIEVDGRTTGAGILDTDRLGPIDGPEIAVWRRTIAEDPAAARVRSLPQPPDRHLDPAGWERVVRQNESLLQDPETFMAKMLEYKGYIEYTGDPARPWQGRLIDPERARRYLPLSGPPSGPGVATGRIP